MLIWIFSPADMYRSLSSTVAPEIWEASFPGSTVQSLQTILELSLTCQTLGCGISKGGS